MAEQHGLQGHSVTDITHALKGIQFPASREDIVKQAEANKAPDDVRKTLDRLPQDGEYGTIAEVMHAAKEAN